MPRAAGECVAGEWELASSISGRNGVKVYINSKLVLQAELSKKYVCYVYKAFYLNVMQEWTNFPKI